VLAALIGFVLPLPAGRVFHVEVKPSWTRGRHRLNRRRKGIAAIGAVAPVAVVGCHGAEGHRLTSSPKDPSWNITQPNFQSLDRPPPQRHSHPPAGTGHAPVLAHGGGVTREDGLFTGLALGLAHLGVASLAEPLFAEQFERALSQGTNFMTVSDQARILPDET
jgi:hypothetical protein